MIVTSNQNFLGSFLERYRSLVHVEWHISSENQIIESRHASPGFDKNDD